MLGTVRVGPLSIIDLPAKLPLDEAVERFRILEPSRISTQEQARQRIGKIFRGDTLLKHALEWKFPTVGGGGKSDSTRGQQWRLVMAYSGYEQIESALFPMHSKHRKAFLATIRLQNRLPGPVLSQRAMDRIEERQTAADELCDFLGVWKSKRGRFTTWLLGHTADKQCVNDRDLFIIAQVRHLVAHGALSEDRASKLGLVPCFDAAPLVLHEVAGAFVQALISKPQKQAA